MEALVEARVGGGVIDHIEGRVVVGGTTACPRRYLEQCEQIHRTGVSGCPGESAIERRPIVRALARLHVGPGRSTAKTNYCGKIRRTDTVTNGRNAKVRFGGGTLTARALAVLTQDRTHDGTDYALVSHTVLVSCETVEVD